MPNATPLTEGVPLVSVIVPAYNAAATIARTLSSVVAQTYTNIEIIVVDDGSTDDTRHIAQTFAAHCGSMRVIGQANGGVAAARNRGLAEAKGKYVAPIDADDVWHPDNLAKQVAALETTGAAFSFARSYIIDAFDNRLKEEPSPEGQPAPPADYVSLLRRNWVGNGSAAVFVRSALAKLGGYDSTLRARGAQGAEDWKVILQLAAKGRGTALADRLIGYRQTPDTMSMNPVAMTRSTMFVLKEMRRAGPRVAPWHFWHARTTIHIGLFYRWLRAGRTLGAAWCLVRAYVGNPLWFQHEDARDFLLRTLTRRILKRLRALAPAQTASR